MTDALNIFTDGWEQLTKSPVWLVIAVASLALGLLCKWVRAFPNRLIPIPVIVCSTALYWLLGSTDGIDSKHPRVMLAIYGFILGFIVWAAHKFLLKKVEKFLPEGFLPTESFDTEEINKERIDPKL